MLVLSRKLGQKIVIGNDITITVVDIRRDSVRFGIDAPASVPIHRSEIHDEIQAERAATLTSTEQAVAAVAPTMAERAKRKGRAG